MSEQKMSRDEMVVGSYVCAIEGDGPRGVVARVELDQRGPEYDLLHVDDAEGPTRCQRAVMRLVDPLATTAHDDVVALRRHVDQLKGALKTTRDERDEAVETLIGMQGEYEQLKLDHAALKSTDAETEAAYLKTHGERYALNEQNIALRAEVAELEAELERRSKVSHEKYAALERDRDLVENAMREASARAQRNEDNLKAVLTREEALRAQLIALEEGAAASRNTARQVAQIAHDRAYEIERQKHEIAHIEKREREALAEAAAQCERADMWQGAAQDALDQMAHWRKQAKEGVKLCETTVGIDFRGPDTAARKLAEVAAAVAPQRDDVRRG